MADIRKPDFVPFKFREILVYGSTEWLADSKKKYQRVFEKSEIGYLYCEFSFYNKLFDEEEWEVKVNLKGFELSPEFVKTNTLCNVEVRRKVKVDENVVYIREGWGNATIGTFWKKGRYMYEAYLDDKLIGSTYFYVEDSGSVTDSSNPYVSVKKVKLFEGLSQLPAIENRIYYNNFDGRETRYVWGEVEFINLNRKEEWYCEIFYNFYNDARQLKGKTAEIFLIKPDRETFSICSGWGSDQKGTWYEDQYTLDIVFMGKLMAISPFQVSDHFTEGEPELLQGTAGVPLISPELKKEAETLEDLMKALDDMIGLPGIKTRIREYAKQLNFLKIRKDKGFDDPQSISLHAVFTGNPGTGKTTVANLLGKIYKKLGLISKGHVHEVDRGDLVGEYIGQTAPRVKEAILKARGGILFIDEAYSLSRSGEDSKDYGREVIEILLREMSDGPGDLAVIVAGYPREMAIFIDSNPGLKSRFNLYFDFPDYMPQELKEIAKYSMEKRRVNMDPQAEHFLYEQLVEGYRNRDKSFGNARWVNSIIDESKMNLGLRIMAHAEPENLSNEELSTILPEDLEKVFQKASRIRPDIPVDEDLLRDSLHELDMLTGMEQVKNEVHEIVDLVKFYRESGRDVLNSFSFHTVFTGNPGTGKTTVARIISRLFKALGILEKGHLVECSRQDLVAGFTGQTAIKTTEIIDRALGGVLFIDEAYSLTSGGQNDFGKEAIETLLKKMEDLRGQFVVIAAGYPENMRVFLESNPGLKSRFDKKLEFGDYNTDQLWEICLNLLKEKQLEPDPQAAGYMRQYLEYMHTNKDRYFGNARSVRKIVEEVVKNQHLRMARMDKSLRTPEMLKNLILSDVEEFKIGTGDSVSSRIGFGVRGGGQSASGAE